MPRLGCQTAKKRCGLISTLFILAMLCACDPVSQTPAEPNTHIVDFVGHQFRVPPRFMVSSELAPQGPASQLPALRIPIDLEEDGSPQFDAMDTDTLSIQLATENSLAQEAQDAWQGVKKFENSAKRRDAPARLFRVFSRTEFPFAWHFFTVRPNGEALAGQWRAKCRVPNGKAEIRGFTNVTCQTTAKYQNIYAIITFSGTRIGCRDRIVERALATLAEWRQAS